VLLFVFVDALNNFVETFIHTTRVRYQLSQRETLVVRPLEILRLCFCTDDTSDALCPRVNLRHFANYTCYTLAALGGLAVSVLATGPMGHSVAGSGPG
jgi:hypothetical protein